MNVLVLGGTQFLGRHIVDALAREGYAVTRFHRGKTNAPAPAGVEDRLGDRNGDLSEIATSAWDVVVDVNAYEPHQVRSSTQLRCSRYIFISTVSVYADFSVYGMTEDAAVIAASGDYGGDKAACERVVREAFPDAAILRPGLIVGPYDPTDRFTYWCERVLRGGTFLAPEPRAQPVQFIDARDIADFVARIVASDIGGTFNLTGPQETLTMESFVDNLIEAAREFGVDDAQPQWVNADVLINQQIAPWTEMPLWLPASGYDGLTSVSNARARAEGLTLRTARETIRTVMSWVRTLSDERERKAGLSAQRESDALREFFGVEKYDGRR